MSTEGERELPLEIGHVLLIDIVGYSKLLINEQSDLLQHLKEMVRGSEQVRAAEAAGKLIRLATGDGIALVFRSSPEAPAQCALELSRADKQHPELKLRMGIHSGPINEVSDVNERANVTGAGINMAQRVMDCGDAGHILLSQHVADDLEQYPRWRPLLHELGECEVKHGVRLRVVNLYTNELGNPELPTKFKSAGVATVPTPQKFSRKYLVLLGGVGAALLIGFLIFSLSRKRGPSMSAPDPARSATSVAVSQKSIAVLPFVNMSADRGDEYLSDGMTEELLNVLGKVKKLRVPGRSSCFAFKGKNEEDIFRKVGEQLHVNTVLEGSVRKTGEKLRITVQLINVADGYHLWSETYDRDMKDILAVQSDVAQRVVQALELQLGVDEARVLAKKETKNSEAHRFYLLGRFHFAKNTLPGFAEAMQSFNQAIQLDPTYALAYCGLADVYSFIGAYTMPGKEAWATERELALKALALDPELAEAHFSLGIAIASAFNWEEGEKEIKRAIEMNPNMAVAYDQYAWLLSCLGRHDEGLAMSKKAIELEPFSAFMNSDRGWWLFLARRYDEAIVQYREALELDPNSAFAYKGLGWCLLFKEDLAGAIAAFQKARTLDPEPLFDAALGYAYAVSGDRSKAEQVLRDLNDLAKQRYVSPGAQVLVYLGLGDKERTYEWLEKCYEEQDYACWELKVDPVFDGMRDEPRFQALLKKVGLDK